MSVAVSSENIIKILGIEDLPNERKLELVDKVSGLVEKRLLLRVLESLSGPKRRDFENILDGENAEAVGIFIEKNVPQFADWIAEEVEKVKQELSGLVAKT